MKLKKMMALVLCAATVAGLGLTGCGNSSDNAAADNAGSAAKESSDAGSTDASDFSGNISVLSREDGSGERGYDNCRRNHHKQHRGYDVYGSR